MPEPNGNNPLAKALLAAQRDMPALHKDATADTGKFKYTYLSLKSLLEQVLPVLNSNGVVLVQAPCLLNGAPALSTTLMHESGEAFYETMLLAVGPDASAQAQGSALTYARRYALLAMLGLAPDEDDDGAAAKAKPREEPKATEPPATQQQHAKHNAMLGELAVKEPKHEGQLSWEDNARNYVKEKFGKSSRSQLTAVEMDELIAWTQGHLDYAGVPL